MVKWKLTPEQIRARELAEKTALARRNAAKAHLAQAGQSIDDDRDARVGTGAASRSKLSKSEDNTVEIMRQRKARELQKKLKAAKARLQDATLSLADAKQKTILGPQTAKVSSLSSSPSGSAKDTRSSSSAIDQLPSGWEPVTDPKSGKVYFWNRQTNITSWVNPSPSLGAGDSATGTGKGHASKQLKKLDPAQHWIIVRTPEGDDYYFWNAVTDDVSWVAPAAFLEKPLQKSRLQVAQRVTQQIASAAASRASSMATDSQVQKRKARWDVKVDNQAAEGLPTGDTENGIKRPRSSMANNDDPNQPP